MRFSLIYRMWAFQIIHDRPLGRADWAFVLGWRQGPGCFIGCASSLGLASGPASPFFKPYKILFQFFLVKYNSFYILRFIRILLIQHSKLFFLFFIFDVWSLLGQSLGLFLPDNHIKSAFSCDAPKPEGPVDYRQPVKYLCLIS